MILTLLAITDWLFFLTGFLYASYDLILCVARWEGEVEHYWGVGRLVLYGTGRGINVGGDAVTGTAVICINQRKIH